MPQTKHKVPFSGKAKKQQLKEKRQRQQMRNGPTTKSATKHYLVTSARDDDDDEEEGNVVSLNQQPSSHHGRLNPNRYNLQFHRETEGEIRQRKEQARRTIVPVPEEALEIVLEDYFPPELSFPVRPPWDRSLTRDKLNANEHRYFTEYVKKIEAKFSWSELSYFEMNLETWRQLWRVLEMADIVLLITDIRFPALMVPPSLYTYVTENLKKELIVVLNKIDLAPAPLVLAWKNYLKEKYPGVHIVMFTSYPTYNLRNVSEDSKKKQGGLRTIRRRGKMRMAAEGAQKLFDACKDLVKGKVDLSSWQEKISEEMLVENEVGDEEVEVGETVNLKSQDTSYHEHNLYEDGVLTIGCVGQPNVGKSSLMNALMGRKVVSVSRTPGHTKHFQTIFLTKTVKLCDCPGLVFPSKVPKAIQVLMGSFPIAQLREPYSCVQYLAERVDLVSLLKIEHPEQDDEWSAVDICDGWAKKKGFYTAKAARLDTYRAANHLLRMALDGKVPLCLRPPGYNASKDDWSKHPEVSVVEWIQALSPGAGADHRHVVELSDSDEDSVGGASSTSGRCKPGTATPTTTTQSSDDEGSEDDSGPELQSANKFHALKFVE